MRGDGGLGRIGQRRNLHRLIDHAATALRFLRDRVPWHRVGMAACLAVIGFALWTLYDLLKDVDLGKVAASFAAMPPHRIAIAALCVGCAYFTITFYDYFALHTIGRGDVPYRTAALGAFTGFIIGHNVGATVFTAGAIRFRIYSRHGLTLVDIARIAFITGLTFWLGNAFVLGCGMLIHPEAASAIDQLPPFANRLLALAGLLVIAGYLIWLSRAPRSFGGDGWRVNLPNARLTLVQIAIGAFDLGFAGLAMWMLMPDSPGIDYASLLVVFVIATLLGFLSHAPGAIGVFDAAMLIALPQFGKEELLASLLMFRLIYFVIPFALALATLAIHELRTGLRVAAARRCGAASEDAGPACREASRPR